MSVAASIHASAVSVGGRAVLIRGPSGAGKSRLAFDLILAGLAGQIPATRLIGDDRVLLARADGRLFVRGAPNLLGLLEIRGLGIRRYAAVENEAELGLIVDLATDDGTRLPDPATLRAEIDGISAPRVPVASGFPALPLVLAALLTTQGPVALHHALG